MAILSNQSIKHQHTSRTTSTDDLELEGAGCGLNSPECKTDIEQEVDLYHQTNHIDNVSAAEENGAAESEDSRTRVDKSVVEVARLGRAAAAAAPWTSYSSGGCEFQERSRHSRVSYRSH